MRYSKILFSLVLILILQNSIYPQEVLKIHKNYVLINIGQDSGLKPGNKLPLLRRLYTGKIVQVGNVIVIEFHGDKCVGKVYPLKPQYHIKVGDFLGTPNIKKGRSNLLSYSLIGAGLLAAGGAFLFHTQANQTFSDYEAAKTTEDATRLYDETASFDKKAQISLGITGGLVVAGVITYLLKHTRKPSHSNYSFSVEPDQRRAYAGFKLNLNVDKMVGR